ncbi:MAG TPA: RNA ligase family protein [Chitinophagaceae bacterium]|nr:RNA ligase family protein [Chitinophagaceae bacterium]
MKKSVARILQDARRASVPKEIVPMALTLFQQPFSHEDWQFEIKWDGFRIISYLNNGEVQLRSKGNNNLNRKFSVIKTALEKLNISAVIDGEAVVLNENGEADFNQIISGNNSAFLVYYVFDILWFQGHDVMNLPLWKRRKLLKEILPKSDVVRFSDHVDTKGKELFELIKQRQVEGIVAKNKNSTYSPGTRSKQWLKIKTRQEVEAIVAGYLVDKDKRAICSLIIGKPTGKKYKYLGLVEAGVGIKTIEKVIQTKRIKTSIFSPVPKVNARTPFRQPIKNAELIWLKPELRCEVKYLEIDSYGMMRHASFKWLIE